MQYAGAHTHTLSYQEEYSLVCTYDNCTVTRTDFGCSHFSVQERGSYVCLVGTSSCGIEKEKKLRATPLEISFTAALPQKEPCITETESVRENATSLKQTHSQHTSALRRT